MKKLISVILLLSFLLSLSAKAEETTPAFINEYVNNEIFVMYNDNSFEVIPFEDERDFTNKITKLKSDENVVLIQPNYTYEKTALSGDPLTEKQWALENNGTFVMENYKNEYPVFDFPFGDSTSPWEWIAPDFFGTPGGFFPFRSKYSNFSTAVEGIDINLSSALDIYKNNGKEIIVAMIDTGIDYTHKELSGRLWINTDEIENNGIDDDNNGFVDDIYGWNFYDNNNKIYTGNEDDHGTHGAGTIIAKSGNNTGISGIVQNENIKVMPVKALGGRYGSGSTASVIRAIQYAEKNGVEICNLSLGTSNNDAAIYRTLATSNMLFVIAAGNDGENSDKSPCYPASYDLENIISVANLNYDGTLNYSSNYGNSTVDLAAPGSYILSTSTNNGYSYMSGTSMSAPFVTAAAALVYSHFDNITLADVKKIILSSVTPLESLKGTVATGGMLNIENALNFDLNNLSASHWEEKTPFEYTGTAPVIKTYLTNSYSTSYLTLQVYDEENDVVYVSYAIGEYEADYFKNGNAETALTLKNGTATFEVSEGTYTIYARDEKGNDTTYSITFVQKPKYNRTPHNSRYNINDFLRDFMRYFW